VVNFLSSLIVEGTQKIPRLWQRLWTNIVAIRTKRPFATRSFSVEFPPEFEFYGGIWLAGKRV